jgi:hypothetical protein
MMMKKKFYYLIEDIDINGDNNTDGFIITKYKINSKTNDKIFLQTKYFSIEDFQKKMLAIRLKQDIAKLKKDITISKKGGFVERHPYVELEHIPQRAQQIDSQQLLVKLEELQKLQKDQHIDPQILLEKLQKLEEKIQSQHNPQHNMQHNMQHNPQYNPQHNVQHNQIMSNRGFDNYMNNNIVDAPPVVVSLHGKKPSMQDNIVEGFGLGLGFAVADNLVDMFF